ncbi:nuclear transport factor 2 family protein [Mycobacterium riyadhense]|uniref:nuclear transport factor 2 family protein n=1 Tax=Mycobacterium riyadhense TaxID=486698 RepID=UPI001EF9E1F2|nr:nuclear transport factor 2 family protein [Mycobacterium riyadhense]
MLAETQITNLLYRYAECIDGGDLAAAAALFEHARIRIGTDETIDAARLLGIWKSLIVLYPDGTPRTKHLVSNPIVEVDEDAGTARCRSYYTVLQQTEEFALQPIVAGATTTISNASKASGASRIGTSPSSTWSATSATTSGIRLRRPRRHPGLTGAH